MPKFPHHPAEASCMCGLPPMLPRLLLSGGMGVFQKSKEGRKKGRYGNRHLALADELPSPPLLQPEASLTAASLCLQSPPSPFTCQSLCLDMQTGCLHSSAFLQETNPRFLGERSDWCPWIKPSLSFNPPPPVAQQWWVQDFTLPGGCLWVFVGEQSPPR